MFQLASKTTALVVFASASMFAMSTAPSAAQDRDGGVGEGAIRDFIQQEFMQGDRGDRLGERFRERQEERRGEMRDQLRDRLMEALEDNPELRDRLRERLRERIGGRIRERIAERRDMVGEGRCFFVTRSLRDEDGDLLVIVRRRVCRD